jgi:hypothetical protein
MIYRTRLANLVAILLTAPAAALAGIHTWDVAEVFSNADGTIQFVEFVDAGISGTEINIGSSGSTSSNAKSFGWSGSNVAPPTNGKRFLVGSQTFQNLTGAPPVDRTMPLTFNSNPILPFFFQPASDTVNFIAYDSCPFTAIPTNGVGSFNCETNVNQTTNSPTNYAGTPGSVIASLAPGLIDNFSNGSTQNWLGVAGTNEATGGPAGAGDRYLQITTPGGPLSAENESQWAGVLPANADRIEADLNNSGGGGLSLRVVLMTPGCENGGGACTAWTSNGAVLLPPGSGWATNVNFSVKEADLTRVLGSDSYAASMANIERVMIRYDDGPPDPPNFTVVAAGTLGIDNVELPEPSALLGLAAGALLVASLRRRS